MKRILIAGATLLLLEGCSAFRGPPGPKLYDKVSIVITSDNALLSPSSLDKEFLRILRTRMNEYAESKISSDGDLKITSACGPRTLQLSIDVVSVNIGSTVSTSFLNPFRASATKGDFSRVAINSAISDCEDTRILKKKSNSDNDEDLASVLNNIASSAARDVYEFQHGPRQTR